MRLFSASFVLFPLVLAGAFPAAGQSAPPLQNGTALQLVGDGATSDRETYVQRAQNDMHGWEQRLNTLGETTATHSSEAGDAAKRDLRRAWAHAQAASHRLQTVSGDGWRDAKFSYERATRDLEGAWHRVHPANT